MSRFGVGADNGAAVAEIETATLRRVTVRTSSNRSPTRPGRRRGWRCTQALARYRRDA